MAALGRIKPCFIKGIGAIDLFLMAIFMGKIVGRATIRSLEYLNTFMGFWLNGLVKRLLRKGTTDLWICVLIMVVSFL